MVTLSAEELGSMSKNILRGPTLRKSHILFILSWSREDDENKLLSELVFLFLIFKDNGKLPTRELSDSPCQLHVIKPEMVRKNAHWVYYPLKNIYGFVCRIFTYFTTCDQNGAHNCCPVLSLATVNDKRVETVRSEIRFSSGFCYYFPSSPQTTLNFLFLTLHLQTTAPSQNWIRGLGDQRIDTRW